MSFNSAGKLESNMVTTLQFERGYISHNKHSMAMHSMKNTTIPCSENKIKSTAGTQDVHNQFTVYIKHVSSQ